MIDGGGKAAGDLANHSNLRSRSRSLASGELVGCKISVLSLAQGCEANDSGMGFLLEEEVKRNHNDDDSCKEDETV